MYTIKTEKLREFIEHKKEEWTVFASGPTEGNLRMKSIAFNLDKNKIMVEVYKYSVSWNGTITMKDDNTNIMNFFDSVTEAVEYFNNEEWCKWI